MATTLYASSSLKIKKENLLIDLRKGTNLHKSVVSKEIEDALLGVERHPSSVSSNPQVSTEDNF